MKTALSTLAVSAYNVVCRQGAPMQASLLFAVLSSTFDDTLTEDDVAEALSGLHARNFLVIVDEESGLVDVADPKRRLVRWRNRNGDGWNRWLVDDGGKTKRIEEVI